MEHIRQATPQDVSRIAEIIITNYRQNFYPIFRNEAYYFGELNVVDMAEAYRQDADMLCSTYVYDDGAVKGVIRVNGTEIEKLFVEPQFQSQGIGAALLDYAVEQLGADFLWVLEYNQRGIRFYQRHGFVLTEEKVVEDDVVPLRKMIRNKG